MNDRDFLLMELRRMEKYIRETKQIDERMLLLWLDDLIRLNKVVITKRTM